MHSRNKPRRPIRLLVSLLGFGFFGLLVYLGGLEAWQRIREAKPLWVGVSFAATALLLYVSAARWGLITNAIAGFRVCSTRAYYHYLMMGKTVGLALSEAVGVYAVGPLAMRVDGQASLRLAAGAMLVDKLFDLGLSGLLLFPTAAYVLQWISLEVCAVLFIPFFVMPAIVLLFWYAPVLALLFRLRDALATRLARVPLGAQLLSGRAGQALLALSLDQVPSRWAALSAYGITVLRYLLMTLRFAAVSAALDVAVPSLLVFVGIPIAQLGLLLAVTPGALGALEAGWFGVLALGRLPRQDIMTFLVGQRAALFVFVLVLGLTSYVGNLLVPVQQKGI